LSEPSPDDQVVPEHQVAPEPPERIRHWPFSSDRRIHESWWFGEIVVPAFVALITGSVVAAGTFVSQARIDDARETHALRLENLRFVRDHSSSDPNQPRPFGGLDLQWQYMRGLELANAKFDSADLDHALFAEADLAGSDFRAALLNYANFAGANLTGVSFAYADLSDAFFGNAILAGADLEGAYLDGASLRDVNLDGVNLKNIYYDSATSWPNGFVPPPSKELPR
jgi:uncharacterized protein YjbI with pentapeptide repeats